MRDLQSGGTGMYWCAVEIGGLIEPDVKEDFYITVKSDPDLSVVEGSVSGQKGGSVSVQCLYSAGYQNEQKQWCRSKDKRCYKVGRTNTSQNSAVQISDDGRRSFSVEMSGLQKSDAGWYWCKTGDLQVPVRLSISDASPGSATVITDTESATDLNGEILLVGVLPAVGLGLLLILVSIIIFALQKKFKKSQMETRERSNNTAMQTSSAGEVTYSTVIKKKKKPSSALDEEHGVIYSSAVTATKNNTLSPAGGDDGVIYSSVDCN
ncbi:hypothetical protein AOLI_G00214560 [Acnodon oligacanthus]